MPTRKIAFSLGFIASLSNMFLPVNASARGSEDLRTYGDYMQRILPLSGLAIATAKGDYEGDAEWLRSLTGTVIMIEATKQIGNQTTWGTRPYGQGQDSFVSGHASYAC